MKLAPRIFIPIGSAVVVVAGLLGIIWWQLSLSASEIALQLRGALARNDHLPFASETAADTSDLVLLHLRQGDLFALRGDWDQAQEQYQTSVQLGGGLPALRKLAQAQMQLRDLEGVRDSIDRLRREGARDEDIFLLESLYLLRTGELTKATELLEKAQDSAQKEYGLALLAIIKGDHEAATLHLDTVIAGDELTLRSYARFLRSAYEEFKQFPASPPLHLTTLLSQALARVQECELALPLIASVVLQQNDYRDAWMIQGYCELVTGREQQALTSFSRAYALDPQKPEIQYFLGRAYARTKQYQDARTFLGYALQNGFSPAREVHERLAQVELDAGDTAAALAQYRKILEDPAAEIADADAFVTLAIGTGKPEDAYAVAQQATVTWPESAKAWELLGWAAAETDRTDEAKSALEKALQMDPTLMSAKEKLGTL
jgi:tetratricopeptide (TPR) repeat protein